MGGRGARSGSGGGSTTAMANNAQSNNGGGVADTQGARGLADYQRMTPSELEALADKMRTTPTTYYSQNEMNPYNPTQRLVDEIGLHGKPVVLDNATYDKVVNENGFLQIYRGVHSNGSMSAQDVRKNTMYADKNYVGDGIHGDGLYFSTSGSTARAYAGRSGAVTQAFIDPSKARIVDEDTIRRMARNDPAHYNSRTMRDISQYALYKGYNCIVARGGNGSISHAQGGEDFYVPIDRSILVIRKTTRR